MSEYTYQEEQELHYLNQAITEIRNGYEAGTSSAHYFTQPLRDFIAQRMYEIDRAARMRLVNKKAKVTK